MIDTSDPMVQPVSPYYPWHAPKYLENEYPRYPDPDDP